MLAPLTTTLFSLGNTCSTSPCFPLSSEIRRCILSEEEFADMAIREMVQIGLIESTNIVMDYHEEKVKKAYSMDEKAHAHQKRESGEVL